PVVCLPQQGGRSGQAVAVGGGRLRHLVQTSGGRHLPVPHRWRGRWRTDSGCRLAVAVERHRLVERAAAEALFPAGGGLSQPLPSCGGRLPVVRFCCAASATGTAFSSTDIHMSVRSARDWNPCSLYRTPRGTAP